MTRKPTDDDDASTKQARKRAGADEGAAERQPRRPSACVLWPAATCTCTSAHVPCSRTSNIPAVAVCLSSVASLRAASSSFSSLSSSSAARASSSFVVRRPCLLLLRRPPRRARFSRRCRVRGDNEGNNVGPRRTRTPATAREPSSGLTDRSTSGTCMRPRSPGTWRRWRGWHGA